MLAPQKKETTPYAYVYIYTYIYTYPCGYLLVQKCPSTCIVHCTCASGPLEAVSMEKQLEKLLWLNMGQGPSGNPINHGRTSVSICVKNCQDMFFTAEMRFNT